MGSSDFPVSQGKRQWIFLALVLLLSTAIFLGNMLLTDRQTLPSLPYALAPLIAAYLLSPRMVAGVTVYAVALHILAYSFREPSLAWVPVLYIAGTAVFGCVSIALSHSIRSQADARRQLAAQHEKVLGLTQDNLQTARERVAADLDAMTRLQAVGRLFVRESEIEPVLNEILEAAIAITNADMGDIQLLDPRSGDLKIVAHRGFAQPFLDYWDSVGKGQGACRTALEKGRRVIVEDVTESPIFVGSPALQIQLAAGVRAVQSTPLFSRSGKPLGMFSTHYKVPRRPDERALKLLDILSRQAADIIERAQADGALRASELKYRMLVEANIAGIFVANLDHIIDANAAFLNMVGYTRADLEAGHLHWREMTPAEYAPLDDRAIEESLARGSFTPFEKEYIRKDGSRVPILIGAALLGREPLTWVCFVLDMTERQRAQEAHEHLLEVRAEQQRMEEMLHMIAHDVRQPLTSVMGMSQWLHRTLVQRGLATEARTAESIVSGARRMNAMLQELVESARLETGQVELQQEVTDLFAFLVNVTERVGSVEDRARVRLEPPESVVHVSIDRDRIERAMTNLLSNALKYSPPESPVLVSVRRPDSEAMIAVTDQGIGIEAADMPHVFERGFRAKEVRTAREGLGLGLYISRLIVEAHGGRIWVESEFGKGSSFYIALPLT